MASVLDLMNHVQSGFDKGRARGQQTRLGELYSQAYSAAPEARNGLQAEIAKLDPSGARQLQGDYQKQDDDNRMKVFGMAKYVLDAYKTGDRAAIQGAYRTVLPHLTEMGRESGTVPPAEFSEDMLPNLHQIMSQSGGNMGGDAEEGYTLAPGSRRFGADNQMVAESPFAPARRQIVNVPDGRGGTVQMEYDGQNYSQPSYGGGTGPGAGLPSVPGGAPEIQSVFREVGEHHGFRITSMQRPVMPGVGAGANSQHPNGTAADYSVAGKSREEIGRFIADLRRDPRLEVIDESDGRTGTGPHIHVELKRGVQLAQNGANPFVGRSAEDQAGRMGYTPPKPDFTPAQLEANRRADAAATEARRIRDRGTAPAGQRFDANNSLVDIPGKKGAGGKELTGELKLKVSLLENAQRAASAWSKLVVGPNGDFNDIRARTPQARTLLKQAVGNKLRAESGAAISLQEIENETERYMGGLLSSDATNIQQAQALLDDLQNMVSGLTGAPGGAGSAPNDQFPGFRVLD